MQKLLKRHCSLKSFQGVFKGKYIKLLRTLIESRPAIPHGFAVRLTVLASISRSHEFLFISHGFSKTYFKFTNAVIFKMFRLYSAFPLQILCMILCAIYLFCVIVLESHHSAPDIAGWLRTTPSASCPASRSYVCMQTRFISFL